MLTPCLTSKPVLLVATLFLLIAAALAAFGFAKDKDMHESMQMNVVVLPDSWNQTQEQGGNEGKQPTHRWIFSLRGGRNEIKQND